MTAGRPRHVTSVALVVGWSLPVVILFAGCGVQREYVRRGQVLDSLAVRALRTERLQESQAESLVSLKAATLTYIEELSNRVEQLNAQLLDMSDQVSRVSRRIGIGRGDITPRLDSMPATDTVSRRLDTLIGVVEQLYNIAYLDFTRGKYEVAIAEFQQYMLKYPNSDNADNAQYWIGECYYSLGRFDRAEEGFKQVLALYPNGNKAAAAAYKLGLVCKVLGRSDESRTRFQQVIRDYPGTSEAKLAQDRLNSQE